MNNQKNALNILAKKYNLELIILFGSHANNTHNKNSDIDIAILGDFTKNFENYSDILESFQKIYNSENIDIAFLNKASPLLKYQVTQKGKLLHGKESRFREYCIQAWKQYLDTKPLRDLQVKMNQKNIQSLLSS